MLYVRISNLTKAGLMRKCISLTSDHCVYGDLDPSCGSVAISSLALPEHW